MGIHPLISHAAVARYERRSVSLLIVVYAALAVLGLALDQPGFVAIGFAIGAGSAIGRYARLSEIIDSDARRPERDRVYYDDTN